MIDKARLNDVIDGVLEQSVVLPTRPYYVNYDLKVVSNYIRGDGSFCTTSKYHIGPYHKVLAQFLLDHWVPTQNKPYTEATGCWTVVMTETMSLKPKKNSAYGAAPTKEEIHTLLLCTIVNPLEVYRQIQELP